MTLIEISTSTLSKCHCHAWPIRSHNKGAADARSRENSESHRKGPYSKSEVRFILGQALVTLLVVEAEWKACAADLISLSGLV
jgi:hypothetical protein